jgi:hypothetical protein
MRRKVMSTSDNTTPPEGTRSPSNSEAQHNEVPPPKTSPYNFYFAIASVGVGAAAYVLTMLIFRELIEAPGDVAIVSGALGVLFTLIGTIAGTFFGIKSSSDTQDKARAAESKANERTQEANKRALDESDKARKASLMVNPKDQEVDARELL